MKAALNKSSRQRVALKLGAVFALGLLLCIGQFGVGRLSDALFIFVMPLAERDIFFQDGFFVGWYALAVLMLASVGICIWSRRFVWAGYVLISAYWLWTYAILALSI